MFEMLYLGYVSCPYLSGKFRSSYLSIQVYIILNVNIWTKWENVSNVQIFSLKVAHILVINI